MSKYATVKACHGRLCQNVTEYRIARGQNRYAFVPVHQKATLATMTGSHDLAQKAFELMQEALRQSEARISALEAELNRRDGPPTEQEGLIESLTARLESAEADCERSRCEAGQLQEVLEAERAKARQLRKRLELAESGPDAVARKEINYWRGRIEATSAELKATSAELSAERETISRLGADITRLENELTLALARAEVADNERKAQAARAGTAEAEKAALEQELTASRERVAQLEADLVEEREHVANVTEVSNDRKDRITKLEERVEEAEERYEEARWRLSQAEHFERLVRRRKKLIRSLLAALRAKHKANTALKAGVDSLRTYKATAEQNQHKLLARIDHLMARLSEADTDLAELRAKAEMHEAGANAQGTQTEPASPAGSRDIAEFELRLDTQAELIQTLEEDLRTARNAMRNREDTTAEVKKLRNELEMKNEVIARLQTDADERERKLARLRGSESESMRLKSEIAGLKEALSNGSVKPDFAAPDTTNTYRTAAEK